MAPENLWRPTFPEFCRLLNEQGVEYLILGGQASILFGVPRSTHDVDLLIRKNPENARRLIHALTQVGFGIARELTPEEILINPIFIFMDQIKVDLFTHVEGVGIYEEALPFRSLHRYRDIEIPTLSLEQLIASKEAIGRRQDQADVSALREIQSRKRP